MQVTLICNRDYNLISVSAVKESERGIHGKSLCVDFRYPEQTDGVAEGDLLSIGFR
jgi:hypothetical protein